MQSAGGVLFAGHSHAAEHHKIERIQATVSERVARVSLPPFDLRSAGKPKAKCHGQKTELLLR